MTEQPSLFTPDTPPPTAPLCPLCDEPAWWMPRSSRWANYCGPSKCKNPIRKCKQCRKPFNRDHGGTRYCTPDCRDEWNRGAKRDQSVVGRCTNCGEDRTGTNIWDLCTACYSRIQPVAIRLRQHHVPIGFVTRILNDPTCFNPGCDTNILEIVHVRHDHNPRPLLVVDHDHSHCPGGHSCGLCVRGLLCSACNTSIGMLKESTTRINGLTDYLQQWRS